MPEPETPAVSPDVSANPAPEQPTSSPVNGSPPPPAAAPAAAPKTYAAMPAKPGTMFHNLSHAFLGGVLGTMAGPEPPSSYAVDDKGAMSPVTGGPDSTRSRLGRIARAALTGLAAGSQTHNPGAQGLSGLAAGFEGMQGQLQKDDLMKRETAKQDFEMKQQAKITAMNIAHTDMEMLKARGDLTKQTLESQQPYANVGADTVNAMTEAGNQIMGTRDMPEEEVAKWLQKPESMNYKKVLSKVEETTDKDGNPTGVNRFYTLVDMKSPIKMTQTMVDHLKAMGVEGADKLNAGDKLNPQQYYALDYQALKKYNELSTDAKNVEVIKTTDKDGNPVQAAVNKVLNTTKILKDETGKPIPAEQKLEKAEIYDPKTRKTNIWAVDMNNKGKKITMLGEAKSDFASDVVGDYTIDTSTPEGQKAFIASLPSEMRGAVDMVINYRGSPDILGRGGQARQQLVYAANYASHNTWSDVDFKNRLKFMNDWTGSQGRGATKDRANTAVNHLGYLAQASQLLANNDLTSLNALANKLGYETGSSAKIVYDEIAGRVAGEYAGASKGGSAAATDSEIGDAKKTWSSDIKPENQLKAITAALTLLEGQKNTQTNDFLQVMKKAPEEVGKPFFNPQSQTIMQKYGIEKPAQTAQPAQGGSPQNGQTPAGAAPLGSAGIAPEIGSDGKPTGRNFYHDAKGKILAPAPGMR